MANETNLSGDQINSIMNQMKNEQNSDGEKLDRLMRDNLSDDQRQAVMNIISDEERLRQILSSPVAKKFLERLAKRGE
ncbi:MAG: hypothetical protein PUB43_06480 [Oscillospiraceae bacterium]|nr:hypothetical protein [Oscillospiraceae bacterium]